MQHPFFARLARLWPIGLLFFTMGSIQAGASLATQLFPLAGVAGTTTIRLTLAALIVIVLARPWRRRIPLKAWKVIVPYGVTLGLMNLLFYEALVRLPQGITVALEFTGPLAVALLASRRWLDLLWVALACAGIVTLLLPNSGTHIDIWPGAFFGLGAGACWAGYILFGRRTGTQLGMQGAVLGIGVGAIVTAPFGFWEQGTALFNIEFLWLGLGVAILSTALPYTLEMIALPRLPAATFGTLMSLEPAFAAFAGLAFLGQQLSFVQWIAVTAIVAASMGTTLTSPDTSSEAATG